MSGDSFVAISRELQEEHISELARAILTEYPLEIQAIELINFEFNATFKIVTSEGVRFALRINVNSSRTIENLRGEIAFISHLRQNPEINLPQPVLSNGGESALSIHSSLLGRNLPVVLYSWLEGEELGDEPSIDSLYKLGSTMALMHLQAREFLVPKGAKLPSLRDFFWGEQDVLFAPESPISDDERDLLLMARTLIESEIEDLYLASNPIAIHADLHGWNVMGHDGEVAIFDFDDSGIGLPIQDLAIALYYLDTPEQEQALFAGYRKVTELPAFTRHQMQALLLQRRMVLLNYLHETSNQEHRDMAPSFLRKTLVQVQTFRA